MSTPAPLLETVAQLAALYPADEPMTDPLSLIVWENVGYLVDDDLRAELFESFREEIGLDPRAMAAAPLARLAHAVRRGRMAESRAERLRHIGEIVLEHAGGDLAGALQAADPKARRRLLKRFPGFGDPGADKVLLFCGLEARPALESNGLRCLVRLGHVAPDPDYARSYRAAVQVLALEGRPGRDWLVCAFQSLRAHGRSLCRRTPLCLACPLDPVCLHQPAPGT
jgi:endonuclease-3